MLESTTLIKERQVAWLRLVGMSIVAGAAGQAFWAAVTKGLTATDYTARIDTVLNSLEEQQNRIPANEKGGAADAGLGGAIAALKKARENAP